MKDLKNKLKVLVAVNSSYARLVLEELLGKSDDFFVSGMASDGDQMLQQLQNHQVDVVLASADLRHNIRLLAFKRIFSENPTPIVMMVDKEELTLDLLKDAIDLGVYGVIIKPGPTRRPDYRSIADDICQKLLAVRSSEYWDPETRLHMLCQETNLVPEKRKVLKNATADTIIVIGASTGGTQAVEFIVKQLDPELNASVLIAIHLPPKFTHSFARRLKTLTPLLVIEGRSDLIPKPGKVIVAPGGRNMVVHSVMGDAASLKVNFTDDTAPEYDMPSVDCLMQSVAESCVKDVIGVILTGMGKDGTVGASKIIKRGGHVIVQDEASSAIFGMAKSAIESGYTDKVLPLSQIAIYLNRYVADKQQQVSTTDMDT